MSARRRHIHALLAALGVAVLAADWDARPAAIKRMAEAPER